MVIWLTLSSTIHELAPTLDRLSTRHSNIYAGFFQGEGSVIVYILMILFLLTSQPHNKYNKIK